MHCHAGLKTIFVFFWTFPNKLALIRAKSKENLDRSEQWGFGWFCPVLRLPSLLLESHLYVKGFKADTKWKLLRKQL